MDKHHGTSRIIPRHRTLMHPLNFPALLLLSILGVLHSDDASTPKVSEPPPRLIQPAVSTETGLLLQPPLDLSKLTTEEFVAFSSTIGPEKIRKKWTDAVTPLPPHTPADVHGLTEEDVKAYMLQVRRMFDEGASVPISDVGLISTQEAVNRVPMFNHIAAFANATVRVYLLVQKGYRSRRWHYFSIVQDLTTEPVLDYYGDISGDKVKFEGVSCYKCHSSGPLAIHPARADLVSDPPLAASISRHIASQPLSRMYLPKGERLPDYGKPLALKFCNKCHDTDADRAPLFKVHAHPIRVLVDFGYMPPKHRLTPGEIAELNLWLNEKP